MRITKYKRTLRVAIILLATLALLGAIEGVLRLAYPLHPDKMELQKSESLAYEFNDRYLLALKPNIQKGYPRSEEDGGQVVTWKSNRDGFRGPELNDGHDYRVMVYGDSNIQARFSKLEDTFVFRLQEKLSAQSGKDIEVVNAGVVGFGPDQSLLKLSEEIDQYQPDLVVFHIFADNDFGDLMRNRLFELDAAGRLIPSSHPRQIDKTFQEFQQAYASRGVLRSSRLVWACQQLGQSLRAKGAGSPGSGAKLDLDRLLEEYLNIAENEYAIYKNRQPPAYSIFADHYDYDVALFPNYEQSVAKIQLMDRILGQVRDLAGSRQIPLVVLVQPSKREMTTEASPNFQDFSHLPTDYKPRNLTGIVETICRQNRISFVNLFDVFKNNNPASLHLKGDDDHWNEAGQDLAADHVAKYLKGVPALAPAE